MTEPTYTLTQSLRSLLIVALHGDDTYLENKLRSLTPNSGEPVGKVVSSGPADLPIFQWISADHSLRCKTGDLLFTHSAPSTKPADAMKNAEIFRGCKEVGISDSIGYMEVFELGVKYAERHHSINPAAPQQGETK